MCLIKLVSVSLVSMKKDMDLLEKGYGIAIYTGLRGIEIKSFMLVGPSLFLFLFVFVNFTPFL